MSEKLFIKNRKDQKISVLLDLVDNAKGLAFVMHGLGGYKEQKLLHTVTEAFKEKNISIVRFDTTNTLGESDGDYADATTTNYYEDLEDVIKWASTQPLYKEPFYISGHSLGGMCTTLFAENYPEKIKGLVPISTVISGKLTLEREKANAPEKVKEWEATGWKITPSRSKPGHTKKLKWNSFVKENLKYDILPNADKLTMPVMLIVGEIDKGTPPEHHKLLYDKLPGKKEMHIIKGADHDFRDPQHLAEIKEIFLKWIE